jgi:hypothetical protein
MRPSHACASCGLDLARVHASREPRYGLNLLTCPGCGSHSVRTHTDLGRRQLRLLASTILAVAHRGAALAFFAIAQTVTILFLVSEANAFRKMFGGTTLDLLEAPVAVGARAALLALVIVAALTGTWLHATYPFRKVVPIAALLVAAEIVLTCLIAADAKQMLPATPQAVAEFAAALAAPVAIWLLMFPSRRPVRAVIAHLKLRVRSVIRARIRQRRFA